LLLINYNATALFLNETHGSVKLPSAVTLQGMEYITGEALRVNAHQSRCFRVECPFYEHRELFLGGKAFESDDPKQSELGWQIRFRQALHPIARFVSIAVALSHR
jgi:hypothetical protein